MSEQKQALALLVDMVSAQEATFSAAVRYLELSRALVDRCSDLDFALEGLASDELDDLSVKIIEGLERVSQKLEEAPDIIHESTRECAKEHIEELRRDIEEWRKSSLEKIAAFSDPSTSGHQKVTETP